MVGDMSLTRARVSRSISATPESVWQLLVDVQAWPRWGPSVRHAVLHGGSVRLGLGVRGTVWTAIGVPMGFTITEFDPGRRWSWSVSGVPATGHEVIPTDNGCQASFDVPRWASMYLTVCAVALGRIERLAADDSAR